MYFAGSLMLEEDAAWHQVIIRDTSFTASHSVAFYSTFPLYLTCGVVSYLYAQTRLPLYTQVTSFPLVAAVVGPIFILPNVGLNEWGMRSGLSMKCSPPITLGIRGVRLVWTVRRRRRRGGADSLAHVEPGRRDLERCAQEHPRSIFQPNSRFDRT